MHYVCVLIFPPKIEYAKGNYKHINACMTEPSERRKKFINKVLTIGKTTLSKLKDADMYKTRDPWMQEHSIRLTIECSAVTITGYDPPTFDTIRRSLGHELAYAWAYILTPESERH
jgi:hypothetical protein